MANYKKSSSIVGQWLKGADVASGMKGMLVSETSPMPSQWTNKDGSPKTQDVAKIQLSGKSEPLNISINRASLNALVDAYGEDSKAWQGHPLTLTTEKVQVAGKRVTVIYLVPEGFVLAEDSGGYVQIIRQGAEVPQSSGEDDLGDEPAKDSKIPF